MNRKLKIYDGRISVYFGYISIVAYAPFVGGFIGSFYDIVGVSKKNFMFVRMYINFDEGVYDTLSRIFWKSLSCTNIFLKLNTSFSMGRKFIIVDTRS